MPAIDLIKSNYSLTRQSVPRDPPVYGYPSIIMVHEIVRYEDGTPVYQYPFGWVGEFSRLSSLLRRNGYTFRYLPGSTDCMEIIYGHFRDDELNEEPPDILPRTRSRPLFRTTEDPEYPDTEHDVWFNDAPEP